MVINIIYFPYSAFSNVLKLINTLKLKAQHITPFNPSHSAKREKVQAIWHVSINVTEKSPLSLPKQTHQPQHYLRLHHTMIFPARISYVWEQPIFRLSTPAYMRLDHVWTYNGDGTSLSVLECSQAKDKHMKSDNLHMYTGWWKHQTDYCKRLTALLMCWTVYSDEQTYWEHIVTTFHLNGSPIHIKRFDIWVVPRVGCAHQWYALGPQPGCTC